MGYRKNAQTLELSDKFIQIAFKSGFFLRSEDTFDCLIFGKLFQSLPHGIGFIQSRAASHKLIEYFHEIGREWD